MAQFLRISLQYSLHTYMHVLGSSYQRSRHVSALFITPLSCRTPYFCRSVFAKSHSEDGCLALRTGMVSSLQAPAPQQASVECLDLSGRIHFPSLSWTFCTSQFPSDQRSASKTSWHRVFLAFPTHFARDTCCRNASATWCGSLMLIMTRLRKSSSPDRQAKIVRSRMASQVLNALYEAC